MKKENVSIIAFLAILIIALIRFFDSSVYNILSTSNVDVIQEYVRKSLSWGIFFGASIAAAILLFKKLLTKQK